MHLALVKFGQVSWFPTEDEIKMIKSIIDTLDILEAGTRKLCGQIESLASADRVRYLSLELELIC